MLRLLVVPLVFSTGNLIFSILKKFKRQMFHFRHIGKREADAEALHGSISTTLYNTRISKPVKKVRNAKKDVHLLPHRLATLTVSLSQ